MRFDFGFYSSILLISFSQGILYSFLLLVKAIKTGNKSNYWLSLFVFLCSLYIAPWMLGFAGWYDNQPYRNILFYTPLQHLLFIGPITYFYIQSLLNPSFRLTNKNFLHLLPGIIYLCYIIFLWIYDTFIVKEIYFYKNGMDKDFDGWYQNLGLVSMLIYFILCIRYYNLYKKVILQVTSFADTVLFKWVKTFLYSFLLMLILPILFDVISYFYPEMNSYKGSWWFFLAFSYIMYYIAIAGYSNAIETKIPFQVSVFENKPILLLASNYTTEEVTIDIDSSTEIISKEASFETDLWKDKIQKIITEERLYQNAELTLPDVAKKLETNASVISKTINQGFELNFNDFINNYRIEAVKNSFSNGEHKKSTILGIAFDAGFNSKATFNRAFKKNTGYSPKEYLEKQSA